MSEFRNRLEGWFEELARVIYRNRIKTILLVLIFFGSLVSQIPKITMDLSTEGFLHDDDPLLLEYNTFRNQFGRDELLIIAFKPENIFDDKFLLKLKKLHEEIEEKVPHVEDVTSMINARSTRGNADELIVDDLLENWPETDEEMRVLKKRVMSNRMYKNLLVSGDGRLTTMIIKTNNYSSQEKEEDLLDGFEDNEEGSVETGEKKYLSSEENSEIVAKVQEILGKYRGPDFPVYLAGSPVITHFLKESMMRDMQRFVMLAVATIAVFLFVMFRRISGVVLPLLIVLTSLLSTIGFMSITGTPIKLPTQILPSFLLAVSIGASVHILAIFFQDFQKSGDKEKSIAYALGHSGLPCVMTHVTTASGLISFSTAELAPVADLGVFASLGVMLALIYTLLLLPAILSFIPLKKRQFGERQKTALMDRLLSWVAGFSTKHPYSILLVTALIILISVTMATTIRFAHDPLRWFPEESSIRQASEKLDRELRGTVSLEVVIDTHKENGLHEPEVLNRLEKAEKYVEALDFGEVFAGKAWSLTTILKEINRALHENRSDHYVIPQEKDVIAQEFLLFENSGSDDLEDSIDSQFSMARFTVKLPFTDAIKYREFMDKISGYFKKNFPRETITVTGMVPLLFRTVSTVFTSLIKSYFIAIIIITILMVILIGRLRIGLLSMIPNITPILIMLGIMGILSLPMDAFTMLVGSIAMGLAVDDTIHFMHNFRRYYEKTGDPVAAVHETLHTAGRAMLVTTIVLSIGFFIFTLATMNNIFNFGLLTGITVIMALLADYFLAPALMVIVNKPKNLQQNGG